MFCLHESVTLHVCLMPTEVGSGIGSPETGVADDCEVPCGCLFSRKVCVIIKKKINLCNPADWRHRRFRSVPSQVHIQRLPVSPRQRLSHKCQVCLFQSSEIALLVPSYCPLSPAWLPLCVTSLELSPCPIFLFLSLAEFLPPPPFYPRFSSFPPAHLSRREWKTIIIDNPSLESTDNTTAGLRIYRPKLNYSMLEIWWQNPQPDVTVSFPVYILFPFLTVPKSLFFPPASPLPPSDPL